MAVKISGLKPTISVPATLYLPVDEGRFGAHHFAVVFKRLGKARRDEINELIVVGKPPPNPVAPRKEGPIPIPSWPAEGFGAWEGWLGAEGQPWPSAPTNALPPEKP